MIIPMLCVTIFVILVVWFLLPRVARLMIHTPTAISIFVCLSMVQLMAVFISMRCTLCGHFLQVVFFFQAEDGIRVHCVTGVQTCALPISQAGLDAVLVAPIRARVRAEPILRRAMTVFAGDAFADFRCLTQLAGWYRVEWRMADGAPLVLRRITDSQDVGQALRAGGFEHRVWPQVVKIMRGPHRVLVPIVSRPAVTTARTATLRPQESGRLRI